MTQNQIAYQQLQETKRHNEATEAMDRSRNASNIASTAIDPVIQAIKTALPWSKFILGGNNNGKQTR